ncbi:hypothetical protein ACWDSJ_08470 [Nocardia sp. NPDC003482]
MASDAARCLRVLGDHHGAATWTERIIALRPKGTRSRALAQVTLASTLIDQGQLDGAVTVAQDALDGIDEVNSHLLTAQLRRVAAQLRPYHRNATVRQFADHLDTVICERTSMHRLADTR